MSPVVPPFFPAPRGGKLAAHRTSRAAVEQLIKERGDLDGTGAVTADLARSAADLVDSARRTQDPVLWMRASMRLQQLLIKLDARSGRDGGNDGGDSGSRAAGSAAELEAAVGAPASMGDSA